METAAKKLLKFERGSEIPALHFGRLDQLEQKESRYRANIPSGTTLETVLQPAYWRHYVATLKENDLINAFWEDGSQEADLRVRFVSPAEAKVAVKSHTVYDGQDQSDGETDVHVIKWNGPHGKFAVVHKVTGVVVRDKLYPKSEAIAYLKTYLRQVT